MYSKVIEMMVSGDLKENIICSKFKMTPVFYSQATCALANSGGGYIIIGIEKENNNFSIIGFNKRFNYAIIIEEGLKKLSHQVKVQYEIIRYDSKDILVVKIVESKIKVCFNNNKYIFEGSEIVKCEGEVIMDMNKIFIVHGHDNEAKSVTARFIEKVGLEAIILHEQASQGKTIIEKIEANSNVGFAVVLYTPCDEGKSKNEDILNLRARQNVVFEHGYLIGKLGRDKVCALVKGDIEKPNDVSGIVYIDFDEAGAWQMALIREMQSVGYVIDSRKFFL